MEKSYVHKVVALKSVALSLSKTSPEFLIDKIRLLPNFHKRCCFCPFLTKMIFDFKIVNFPYLDGDVNRSTSHGIYISQLN